MKNPKIRPIAEEFPDEDLAHLNEVVDRLHRLLGPLASWRATYLREMIFLLPELAQSFRSVRPPARPSELARSLGQIQKNPLPLIKALVGPAVTRDEAWNEIQANTAAAVLLYYYARMNWEDRAEHHLGEKGDALDRLRACPNPAEDLTTAATNALKELERRRPRGKGGPRNVRDGALQLASEHVLEVYVTITRQLPTVSVLSKDKNPAVQIKGTSVEFLEICLAVMGLRASRASLRRCIEDYCDRKRRARHVPQ